MLHRSAADDGKRPLALDVLTEALQEWLGCLSGASRERGVRGERECAGSMLQCGAADSLTTRGYGTETGSQFGSFFDDVKRLQVLDVLVSGFL